MTAAEYREYLKTPQWKELSRRVRLAQGKCQRCGVPGHEAKRFFGHELHIHHLAYENVGSDEEERDLCGLCAYCHARHHEKPAPGWCIGDVEYSKMCGSRYWSKYEPLEECPNILPPISWSLFAPLMAIDKNVNSRISHTKGITQ
jgi:hypothetical protein